MARKSPRGRTHAEMPPWHPPAFAVSSQRWFGADEAQPVTVLWEHPQNPFMAPVEAVDDACLQPAALAYLKAALALDTAEPRLALPLDWITALDGDGASNTFGWMPIEWPVSGPGPHAFNEPIGSFRLGDAERDHVVVLLASERAGPSQFIGSGFGLRIVVSIHPIASGGFESRMHGLSASLPYGEYARSPVADDTWSLLGVEGFLTRAMSPEMKEQIASIAGLDAATVRIRGLRLAEVDHELQVERRGVGALPSPDGRASGTPYAYTLRGTAANAGVMVHRTALVADAADAAGGRARVFLSDPASQGTVVSRRSRSPTREEKVLNSYRQIERITDSSAAKPLAGPNVKVVPCPRFERGDRNSNPQAPRPVRLPGTGGPQVRSADASAVQGFRHTRELLQRLHAYGLPPGQYFRIAKPEIDIAYRSGISPGPGKDGRTVNARVLPTGWPVDFMGPTPLGDRPSIQLHLGCADLTRRARTAWKPDPGTPSPASPLGIAADARWMWHEFGHVLLMATTGELELRFAHSPGDALAAIVMDPDSRLRGDPQWRYATFPWVYLPRRHDRCPGHGWSWGGAIHAALAAVPDSEQPRRKGYGSEQILSSSLFRLYRCLGGDTARDPVRNDRGLFERQRASHYTVYLLMRALYLLGDARVTPAKRAEDLVFWLRLADISEGKWSALFPAGTTQPYARTGGCAHKAIRWAFEAQGMYVPAGGDGNAIGAPPDVDIYIESQRPQVENTPAGPVDYGPGSYAPVSLHWQDAPMSATPGWQAAAHAIHVRGDGKIEVRVGNRGRQPARGVAVSVSTTPWPASGALPDEWPHQAWIPGAPSTTSSQDIGPGASATFGPFDVGARNGSYIVFAQATCHADRANTDLATGYACAAQGTPIADLVANDNNLGLCVVP